MNKSILGIAAVVGVALLVLLYNSLFTVHQTQQALVLQFGEVRDEKKEPGLHFKLPFIQNVVYLDKRILPLNSPPQEVQAAGQTRLVVDAFARYRIVEPLPFYQSLLTISNANNRLATILNASVRQVLGGASFTSIVRDDRPELMDQIATNMTAAVERFGIDIVDVKIRRADLPEENSLRVFERMKTQRQQEAAEIRARGEEAARRIRARADRDVTVLLAEADRESNQIRGDGDAERNSIFAAAFTQDPDFFSFYRSMQAYEAGLRGNETRLVLSPDSDFFRYFQDPTGRGNPPLSLSAPGASSQVAPQQSPASAPATNRAAAPQAEQPAEPIETAATPSEATQPAAVAE